MARIAPTLIIVLAVLCGAATANAQTSEPSERLEAARQLVEVMGPIMVRQLAEGVTAGVWKQVEPMIRAEYPGIDDTTLNDLRAQLETSYEELVANSLKEAPAIYARHFTASELRELAQFYKTPLGVKLLTETPGIMQDIVPLVTQASTTYTQKIDTALAAILKRHGYK